MSLVFGEEDSEFLRKRHAEMIKSNLFRGMQFSTDHDKLREWIPLVTVSYTHLDVYKRKLKYSFKNF